MIILAKVIASPAEYWKIQILILLLNIIDARWSHRQRTQHWRQLVIGKLFAFEFQKFFLVIMLYHKHFLTKVLFNFFHWCHVFTVCCSCNFMEKFRINMFSRIFLKRIWYLILCCLGLIYDIECDKASMWESVSISGISLRLYMSIVHCELDKH